MVDINDPAIARRLARAWRTEAGQSSASADGSKGHVGSIPKQSKKQDSFEWLEWVVSRRSPKIDNLELTFRRERREPVMNGLWNRVQKPEDPILAIVFRFRFTFLGAADFRAIRGGAWPRGFE